MPARPVRAAPAPALAALALALAALPAGAQDVAGRFDYYVLALSWSPNWCLSEGAGRGAGQCAEGAGVGWVLHGLWPQYEEGWPSDCFARHGDPSRAQTAAMADIMGSAGLAWYQWNRHGACAGLPPAAYFAQARAAWDSVTKPEVFARLAEPVRLPASLVEEAFLRENPALSADGLTVTCRDGMIREVRICLTRDLAPRACAPDVRRDCALSDAWLEPVP